MIFAGVVSAAITAQLVEMTDSYDELADAAFQELRGGFDKENEERERREKENAAAPSKVVEKSVDDGGVDFDDF